MTIDLRMLADQVTDLRRAVDALQIKVDGLIGQMNARPGAPGDPGRAGTVADDQELDSRHGDPEVFRDPSEKYWKGESFKGRPYSTCTADYLESLAKYLDACAFASDRDGNTQRAGYQRKDAARARGWAKRVREAHPKTRGATTAAPPPPKPPAGQQSLLGGAPGPTSRAPTSRPPRGAPPSSRDTDAQGRAIVGDRAFDGFHEEMPDDSEIPF